RDSKAVDGPVVAVPVTAFAAFVAGVQGGASCCSVPQTVSNVPP
ncbi:DUF397 domain-containing protein, partial [Streptomyces rubiginosohelvolus]